MWFQGTVADVTDEQANALPPGVAHPIGWLMAHIIQAEDFMINQVIRGKPPIWESEGWKDKVGGEMMLGESTEAARAYKCKVPEMKAYGEAVFANTNTTLGSLKEADLERELNLVPLGFPSNMSMGVFLTTMLVGNTYAHTGEISSLKGSLGKQGYPF
jgi:hypothetical protein